MLQYRLRPLTDTSWLRASGERKSPKFSMDWDGMLGDLEREIDHLAGYDVIIEVHADASSISHRTQSLARGAVLYSPAVKVGFETEDQGEMVFPSDMYRGKDWSGFQAQNVWRYNVHAVTKHLEALRALERHGVARGEQYDAYKALPSGSPAAVAALSAEEAIRALLEHADMAGASWPFLPAEQMKIVKRARRRTHPDGGGRQADWDLVDQAVQTLVTAEVIRDGS